MNKILIFEELEAYVYHKCFGLYSILYDGFRNILQLFGRRGVIFEKYFKKIFENRPPLPWEECEVYVTWVGIGINKLT